MSQRRAILIGLIVLAYCFDSTPVRSHSSGDYVVLLHGMGRTALSMKTLERALEGQGYRVINVSYPSTRLSIQALADGWLPALLEKAIADRSARVHFVTHSLGGIIVRQHLAKKQIPNLGRVVMLAPPNQGSELADKLKANSLYRFWTGPAGQQLGTATDSIPNQLEKPAFELGVVAGDRSSNPFFSSCISGPDDGKVSVEHTKIEGMKDFLLVHHTHASIMCKTDVIAAVQAFLQTGTFEGQTSLNNTADSQLRGR